MKLDCELQHRPGVGNDGGKGEGPDGFAPIILVLTRAATSKTELDGARAVNTKESPPCPIPAVIINHDRGMSCGECLVAKPHTSTFHFHFLFRFEPVPKVSIEPQSISFWVSGEQYGLHGE